MSFVSYNSETSVFNNNDSRLPEPFDLAETFSDLRVIAPNGGAAATKVVTLSRGSESTIEIIARVAKYVNASPVPPPIYPEPPVNAVPDSDDEGYVDTLLI